MVVSADQHLFPGRDVTFHVFTDQPDAARQVGRELSRGQVVAFEIPSYGWPEATLYRYQFAADHVASLEGDVLMHLDADMVVVDDVGADLNPYAWMGGLAFVRHPGFRRPTGIRAARYYLGSPRTLREDLRAKRLRGGLGAWESRPASTAFLPRERRKHYVYGAIWMGLRDPINAMCAELASEVRVDLAAGLIADWHDESHLNRYAGDHPHSLLDCDYCHVEGWGNLSDLQAKISVVDKGSHLTRE